MLQWGRSVNAAETITRTKANRDEIKLQWGRSVNAAETTPQLRIRQSGVELQWGRSVNAAETISPTWRRSGRLIASMGPQR